MESEDKLYITVFACVAVIFASFAGYYAHRDHVRGMLLDRSENPIMAACAFDANDRYIPPSCMAYMLRNKETAR
jgi:hypothetical protein